METCLFSLLVFSLLLVFRPQQNIKRNKSTEVKRQAGGEIAEGRSRVRRECSRREIGLIERLFVYVKASSVKFFFVVVRACLFLSFLCLFTPFRREPNGEKGEEMEMERGAQSFIHWLGWRREGPLLHVCWLISGIGWLVGV